MIDIECLEDNDTILVRSYVTHRNTTTYKKPLSTHRHLEPFINKGIKAYPVFISPQIFIDTKRYFNFIKNDSLEIRTSEIYTFVNTLENYKKQLKIYCCFNNNPLLKMKSFMFS